MNTRNLLTIIAMMLLVACGNNKQQQTENQGDNTPVETLVEDAKLPEIVLPEDAIVFDTTDDGNLLLYKYYTDNDIASNKENVDDLEGIRNSLFLLDRRNNTTEVIFSVDTNEDIFFVDVMEAKFSNDEKRVLIINDPHTYTYTEVLYYDINNKELKRLSDGDGITDGTDGNYYVTGAKGYYEEFGAFLYTRIMTHDGQTIGGQDTID